MKITFLVHFLAPKRISWSGAGIFLIHQKLPLWNSDLPLIENFDGLFFTGAKIFAFEICLENRTNCKAEKFSF